jgi:transcription initiation factor TFIID TATA-box-binding protein
METVITHPSTAAQAKNFTAPGSLSFPGGAGDLTPPSSEKDGQQTSQTNGAYGYGNTSQAQGQQQQQPAQQAVAAQQGAGVTPATPAATPGAGQGVSGIVPTLQ